MTEEDDKRKIELGKWLSEIYKFSTGMVRFGGIEFTLDSEVLDAYNNWCEKVEEYIIESEEGKEFAAYFGRLQNDVIKMACFFEIGKARYREKINKVNKIHKLTKLTKVADVDSLSQLTKNFAYFVNLRKIPISQESLEVAIYYATNFFIPYWIKVSRYIIANEDADKIEKVFNIAIRFSREGKIKHSDLLRHSHMSARFFEECVKTLVDSGRFEEERVDTGGSKSQKWYRPIEVDKEKKSLPKPKIPTFSIEKEEAKELDDLINKIKKSKKDDYDTP